jgi:hypothetical protein
MTYKRFEDVPVWQKAGELYEAIEESPENQVFVAALGFELNSIARHSLSPIISRRALSVVRQANFSPLFTLPAVQLGRCVQCFV